MSGGHRPPLQFAVMRRYPRISGPAALPLFCLAPHGVFPASRITPRAVSSYLAFSPLPAPCCQRTGGVFSVTLSVAATLRPRRPRLLRGMLPYGVRTFLQQASRLASDRLPSCTIYHNLEATKPRRSRKPRMTRITRMGFHFCHVERLLLVNSFACHSERSGAEPKNETSLTISQISFESA
jgi:hypothetical protein